ncbi:hypothetical protein JCM25156A_23100 [Komagataeibacter kakiaceti JCM 25156]|uniref:hypothetical protein n=1 Tax=Komagataeibacter kakiaceti TaxID=943261 RepID=UPI000B0115FC|nr:hypothetical protein [Komagataeibacter kakiaceti]
MNRFITRHRRAAMFMLLTGLLAVMATSLDACGRIGTPRQPAHSSAYYRSYPSSDR